MNRKIRKAMEYSAEKHKDQTRKYVNLPYFIHPFEVFKILSLISHDEDILCAGLLHDVIEDTDVTEQQLIKEFGSKVTRIVMEVTCKPNIKTRMGLMVKLADMLSNIKDCESKGYLQEKIKFTQESDKMNLKRVSDDDLIIERRLRSNKKEDKRMRDMLK